MKKTLLGILFTCLFASGCTKLIMYSYGIRNPKIESPKSILTYLYSNNLDTSDVYSLRDTTQLNFFFKSDIGVPEIRFYDHNGYLMLYRDEQKCNGQNDSLINFLNPHNIVKVDSTNNLFNYLGGLKRLTANEISEDAFKNKEFYLVMYWAKYLGKTNSLKMKSWENTLKEKSNLKLKTIKVTVDYMDFWPLNKKDIAKIYAPKTKVKESKK
jgi:hypothetical protein